jgi:steroid 5-alpha reductase family enzyme
MTEMLAATAIVTVACFLALWLIALALKDVSFIDSWWALGVVVTAWVAHAFAPGSPHAVALVVLCTVWGLRLGLYLLWRWRSHGVDRRYAAILGKAQARRGWSFAWASLVMVFALQAPLQWIVSLPVQLGQMSDAQALGALAWLGVALSVTGILFETIGDWQLARFRASPDNAGKVLDTGLWRFTRHPNYFGDACVWWGLYLIAADAGFALAALPGPLLMTYLLTSLSGMPTVEGHLSRTKPGYADYVRRTSGFIPLPPKGPA